MKALRKLSYGANQVKVVDVPEPAPGYEQVLIKVERAGVCGTDLHILHDLFSKVKPPVTLGHELQAWLPMWDRESWAGTLGIGWR